MTEAASVLSSAAGVFVDPTVAAAINDACDGDPRLLSHMGRTLTEDELVHRQPLRCPLPLPEDVNAHYRDKIGALSIESRLLLALVFAADGLPEATAAALGVDESATDLAGLIELDEATFRCAGGIARQAVAVHLTAGEIGGAHRLLADHTGGLESLLHQAAAVAPGDHDADLADKLELEAVHLAEGVPGLAGRTWLRAAELSDSPADDARRSHEALVIVWISGDVPFASQLIARCAERRDDLTPDMRAVTEQVAGELTLWKDGPTAGVAQLDAVAARCEAAGLPGQTSRSHALASLAALLSGDVSGALARAELGCVDLSNLDMLDALPAQLMRAFTRLLAAHPDAEGDLAPLCDLAEVLTEVRQAELLVQLAAYALLILERYERSERLIAQLLQRAEHSGDNGYVPWTLALALEGLVRTGRMRERDQLGMDFDNLRSVAALPSTAVFRSAVLSTYGAALGTEPEDTRLRAAHACETAGLIGAGACALWAEAAAGQLELALGRIGVAAVHLDHAHEIARRGGLREPGFVWWRGDHIEALTRIGRLDEAGESLAELEAEATATGRGWALAAVHRGRALLADTGGAIDVDDPLAEFATATTMFGAMGAPVEAARTELLHGYALRRRRRFHAAAGHFERAYEAFVEAGAGAWADRARDALARGAAEPASLPADHGLTRQEELIVSLVVGGATNDEVAQQLGLSRRTIEHHLSSVFLKAGVANRTELVSRVAQQHQASPPPVLDEPGYPLVPEPGLVDRAAADRWLSLDAADRALARQVRGGASNAVLADRSGVSVKTIERRLTRLYRALGVTSRTQLAWLVGTVDAENSTPGEDIPPD